MRTAIIPRVICILSLIILLGGCSSLPSHGILSQHGYSQSTVDYRDGHAPKERVYIVDSVTHDRVYYISK